MQNNNEKKEIIVPIITCEEVTNYISEVVRERFWDKITDKDITYDVTNNWSNDSKSLCSFDLEFASTDNQKKAYRVRIMPVD